ncbi:MAG: hypothetical protein ACQERD_10655 [Campylobacterota bacterium]
MHQQKNYTFLIECFAEVVKKHDNAKLIIVGEGELEMDDYIEEFQSNIINKLLYLL